ncbi:family 61 glycosyl hydrolase [Colletotrichum sublineola]|nr:family 61 glycosyl hydrolase [Colletotrichum sublineola]
MKVALLSAFAFASMAHAHAIFQKVSVNGKEYGSLAGLRAPNQNNPTQDVSSQDIICGKVATSSQEVITVAPGDRIGAWWQHGPITAWLAKVPSASGGGVTGLQWFKVAEDTLDTGSGQWAVDKMIGGGGWSYFDLPRCIAPGDYLLRVELLALHSAYSQKGAQFYISCANIRVTGSGTFSPSSTVSFPGAYQQSDPSIQINIYGAGGVPNNGGKAYSAPGPRPITC